jgi:Mn-containing catalase
MGNPWTADYLKITGELDVDLRSNIAAEARAKIVYERLINFCDDVGTKDALQFLMTREITHMKAFAAALDSLEKPPFSVGRIAPTPSVVNQFFNDSTGKGENGEIDVRGPWNEGDQWEFVDSPALYSNDGANTDGQSEIGAESANLEDAEPIRKLLIEQLRDMLHAEKQLVAALPKMAKAARFSTLSRVIETHFDETKAQVQRLNECFELLGLPPKAKACRGMQGLVEEGQEMIAHNKRSDDASADLSLIAAAQRVEHYEISAYTSAKNLAQQIGIPEIVQLLSKSLAEEANSDQLLDQVARSLMSVARMPAAIV